ncbi:MAG: type I 3-dehydroquinate dehydratase [Deferribacteraceae bacterium]|jgi:3-dehydroquinate dehydratase-1|nr:type I 3-dehydroquinate dehydratase [Deferribacteraceae bacterium]
MESLTIGSGKPKLIVCITSQNILELSTDIKSVGSIYDILEWRADQFIGFADMSIEAVKSAASLMKKPLLFTYRTKSEGGAGDITVEEYTALNKRVLDAEIAELIDIEYNTMGEALTELVDYAHAKGVKALASMHDFEKTPSKEEIIAHLNKLQAAGDISKIAVMPKSEDDVITLVEALLDFRRDFAKKPYIGISMSKLGFITRAAAEFFSCAAVYASLGKLGAPGQVDAETMMQFLDEVHSLIQDERRKSCK